MQVWVNLLSTVVVLVVVVVEVVVIVVLVLGAVVSAVRSYPVFHSFVCVDL